MAWYEVLASGIWEGIIEIFSAFFRDYSIWWYLFPMFTLWFILEIYFGQHKQEQLGWNTALANGFSLVWMNIEAMRMLFAYSPDYFLLRFTFIFMIMSYGVWLIYISFVHKFDGRLTFHLAAPTPIYYLSIVSVLWGHGLLNIGWWVLLDIVIGFWIVFGLVMLLRRYLPDKSDVVAPSQDSAVDTPNFDVPSDSKEDNEDESDSLNIPDLSDFKL